MAIELGQVIADDSDRNKTRREEERKGKGRKEDRKATSVLLGPEGKGFKGIK